MTKDEWEKRRALNSSVPRGFLADRVNSTPEAKAVHESREILASSVDRENRGSLKGKGPAVLPAIKRGASSHEDSGADRNEKRFLSHPLGMRIEGATSTSSSHSFKSVTEKARSEVPPKKRKESHAQKGGPIIERYTTKLAQLKAATELKKRKKSHAEQGEPIIERDTTELAQLKEATELKKQKKSHAQQGRPIIQHDDTTAGELQLHTRARNAATEVRRQEESVAGQGEPMINSDIKQRLQDAADRAKAKCLLNIFRDFRLRSKNEGERRPDLKAYELLKSHRSRVNGSGPREGVIPSVKVGDRFNCRAELMLISLHGQPESGIDYFTSARRKDSSVALSVVISPGAYLEDREQGDTIWYTGEGRYTGRSKGQQKDQEMNRGNLALRNSHCLELPVRVIRGQKNNHQEGSYDVVYYYLGMYDVKSYKYKKLGETKYRVYSFQLVRQPGQGAVPGEPCRGGVAQEGQGSRSVGTRRRNPRSQESAENRSRM